MATIKGGRPGDPIRQFFNRLDGSKSKCIDCAERVSNKIERLRAHRRRCPKSAPADNGGDVVTPVKRPFAVIETTLADSDGDRADVLPPPMKRVLQAHMSAYTIKTDSNAAKELDVLIAKFFYACNVPFNVAEQTHFKQMISALRPGYTPPDRKKLSGFLLDTVFVAINGHVADQLEGKDVTLVQDGWSDIHNQPVIASCVHTGSKSFFLSADDTGSHKKTATYCASLAEKAVEDAKSHFKCNVRAVVTDNEKKMEVMRQQLKDLNEELVVYGCSSHLLNLLGEDVTPSQVTKHIIEVNKYFRNHHRIASLLSNCNGSLKPQLIGSTRWNSQLECMRTYITNRPFYIMIMAQHEELIEARIQTIINNVALFREAKHLLQTLTPIADALDKLQSDYTNIADACETWINLLQNDDLQPHRVQIQKRFDQAMTPNHFLAHCLHPKYRGRNLTVEQLLGAHQLLISKDPDMMPHLASFQAESSPFP